MAADVSSWLSQAAAALEEGSLKRAERAVHQAREAGEPEVSEVFEALRMVRQGMRRVRRRPRDAQGHLLLAKGYFLADAGDAALRAAREALLLEPRLGEAHALIGLEQCYRGQSVEAADMHLRAALLLPGDNLWLRALEHVLAQPVEEAEQQHMEGEPGGNPLGKLLGWVRRGGS